MRLLRLIVVAGLVALATTACVGTDDGGHDAAPPLNIDVEHILREAQESGANDKQRAALAQAHADGEFFYDVVEDLFLDYADCLEVAGFTVHVTSPHERFPGLFEPAAQIQSPQHITEKQAHKADLQCARTHYMFAHDYYVSQPVAIEAYLATFETQRDAILTCLTDLGHPVDADATPTELLYAVTEHVFAQIEQGQDYIRCWEGRNFAGYLPK